MGGAIEAANSENFAIFWKVNESNGVSECEAKRILADDYGENNRIIAKSNRINKASKTCFTLLIWS